MPFMSKIFRSKKSKRNNVQPTPGSDAILSPTGNLGNVFKELDCPVCFNTCIPPIHSCINGHIICNTCRGNVRQCPSCRHGFSGTRNFFAENFINNCSQTCRYSKQGCEFLRLKGDNMRPHEEQCMFRPVNCLVPTCAEKLSYKSLLSHLTFHHKICGTDALPAIVTFHADQPIIRDRKWLPFSIQAYDNVFYVMMEVIRPHFWVWVWLQTTKVEDSFESLFTSEITIRNKEKKLRLQWEGPVQLLRTSERIIMKDGLCFVAHEVFLQHFNANGYFTFHVNIKKIPRRTVNELTSCESANNNLDRSSDRSLYESSILREMQVHEDINGNIINPREPILSTDSFISKR